ncbi:MAG: ROK family protein, partial [Candidatus Bipolaricaulota bacterium]|nr:ROK family protein [Candidatus Bipolaricaulota bacterium]
CPVSLQNDCNGAVLGEVYDGLGRDVADKTTLHLAYVTISTGFGVGAWDGGHLILGKDGNAGEIGHILVHEDGLPCGCGNRGCVEAYASGSGIARNAVARLRAAPRGSAGPLRDLAETEAVRPTFGEAADALDSITAEMVFRAAVARDPLACEVIDDAVYASGIAFAAVANAYDPETISVGGSVALAHPELIERIRTEMLRHLNVRPPNVLLTPLGGAVTEHGALAVARSLLATP